MPKGVKVVQDFVPSFDETRRVAKMRARFVGHPWGEGRLPLFDDEMSTAACMDYLRKQAIPREVTRGACMF